MASTFSQLPGDLGLQIVRGDELTFSAVFAGIDLTGYAVSSKVYAASRDTVTELATPTVSASVATVGGVPSSTVQVSMTEAQTAAIPSSGSPRWYLRWVSPGGVTRTVLSGMVQAQNP